MREVGGRRPSGEDREHGKIRFPEQQKLGNATPDTERDPGR
jgi:hypothetical protein